eukprot:COSAG01_NODE_7427_length_3213_cov_10.489724_2_plen_70_part_00
MVGVGWDDDERTKGTRCERARSHAVHYADRVGENYLCRHSPSHRWLYRLRSIQFFFSRAVCRLTEIYLT